MHMEDTGTHRRSSPRHEHRHRCRRRLRDPARRRGRRTQPRAAARGRALGVDPRVLLRLAAGGAGDVHHRVPRRRAGPSAPFDVGAARVRARRSTRSHLHRSLTYSGTSTCSTPAPSRPTTCSVASYDVKRGLADQRSIGFCFYDLAPDEALHVRARRPADAKYWSLQLYRMRWLTPYDIGRTTSLNHTQMHVGDDGRFQVVVAHRGSRRGEFGSTPKDASRALVNFRYFWGDQPAQARSRGRAASTTCAPSSPPTTHSSPPAARTEELRARRDHLAWRFRT